MLMLSIVCGSIFNFDITNYTMNEAMFAVNNHQPFTSYNRHLNNKTMSRVASANKRLAQCAVATHVILICI